MQKEIGGNGGGWAISTKDLINISKYRYICCEYTASNMQYNDGIRLRLNNSLYTKATGLDAAATYNSPSFEYDVENKVFKWDISQIPDGKYYVGIGGSGSVNTYIYSIWLE